jgi:branched-chain amino acid transport system permease protein
MLDPTLFGTVVFSSLFGLMAVGLTVTYMTTKVPNFAYGSFVTIGVYIAFDLFMVNGINPYLSAPIAFVATGLVSVGLYLLVLRPMAKRGSSLVSMMIATLGADIVLTGMISIFASYLYSEYKITFAYSFPLLDADFKLLGVQGRFFVTPITLGALALVLYILFTRTKFGIAMRAAVENASLAKSIGINVDRVYIVAWFLAGGLAGIAGCIYTLNNGGGTYLDSSIIVAIFAASVLGGLSSVWGAMVGGILIGAAETVLTAQGDLIFGSSFDPLKDGIALIVMIVTLLVIPQGLASINWRKTILRGWRSK